MRVDSREQMNNPSLTFFFWGGKNIGKKLAFVLHITQVISCVSLMMMTAVDQTDEKLSAAMIWLAYSFC